MSGVEGSHIVALGKDSNWRPGQARIPNSEFALGCLKSNSVSVLAGGCLSALFLVLSLQSYSLLWKAAVVPGPRAVEIVCADLLLQSCQCVL